MDHSEISYVIKAVMEWAQVEFIPLTENAKNKH